MSTLSARMAATATRLLTQYGRTWTITKTVGAGSATTRTVRGVLESQVHRADESGLGLQIGDRKFILDADASPVRGERMEAGEDRFVIVAVEAIKPAEAVVAWYAWGRPG